MKRFLSFLLSGLFASALLNAKNSPLDYLRINKIILENGKTYTSENSTEAAGKGIIYYIPVHSLSFELNKLTGEFGFYDEFGIASTPVYEGSIKNGRKDGYGVLKDIDSITYAGYWKHDLFHGKGTFFQERTELKYEGDFVEGRKDGMGKISYWWNIYLDKKKQKYSLRWDREEFSEKYSFVFEYTGPFQNDKASGEGICSINREKSSEQRCVFKDGVLKSKVKLPNGLLLTVE